VDGVGSRAYGVVVVLADTLNPVGGIASVVAAAALVTVL
jgi:hypothetical protein